MLQYNADLHHSLFKFSKTTLFMNPSYFYLLIDKTPNKRTLS